MLWRESSIICLIYFILQLSLVILWELYLLTLLNEIFVFPIKKKIKLSSVDF